MRRKAFISVFVLALLAPATAFALQAAGGDGTLVVQNGTAPKGVPVATLVITGAVIGQISGSGKVVIDDPTPNDNNPAEVTGYTWHRTTVLPTDDTEDTYGGVGPNFRFRAVGGTYKIVLYGSDVDLVASGQGTVVLTGSSDVPSADGRYSVNGQGFKSLPATPTKPFKISSPTSATG